MRRYPDAIDNVETLPCPARTGGPHKIEAGGINAHRPGRAAESPTWACRWCGVPWADLDAAVRERLRPPGSRRG